MRNYWNSATPTNRSRAFWPASISRSADITDLTERIDNFIKFLSDIFYARAYRMAAARIGVNDHRTLVDEKLRTAGDLYRFCSPLGAALEAYVRITVCA